LGGDVLGICLTCYEIADDQESQSYASHFSPLRPVRKAAIYFREAHLLSAISASISSVAAECSLQQACRFGTTAVGFDVVAFDLFENPMALA